MGVHEVFGVGDFVVDEGDGDGDVKWVGTELGHDVRPRKGRGGVGRALGVKGRVEKERVEPAAAAGAWRDEGAREDAGIGDSRGRRGGGGGVPNQDSHSMCT